MSEPQNLTIQGTELKSPILICGEGRSGTRLIRNIFGKHKNISEILRETYIYGTKSIKSNKLFNDLERKKDFDRLTLAILTAMHFKKDVTYKKIIKNDFDSQTKDLLNKIKKLKEYNEVQNKYDCFNICANYLTLINKKIRWVEKTPSNIYNTQLIFKEYPKAKIIVIYRDPRAVCLSWKKKDKNKSTLGSIISWNNSISTMLKELKAHNSNIAIIKYEDLIRNPEKAIKLLCDFIDEPYDSAMLEDISVVNSYFADSKQKKGFDIAPLYRWKDELSNAEKLFLDITTKKNRQHLGYKDSSYDFSVTLLISFILFTLLEPLKFLFAKTKKLINHET